MRRSWRSGTVRRASAAASSTSWKRLTGATRPAATTSGTSLLGPPGLKNGSTPLSIAVTRSGL